MILGLILATFLPRLTSLGEILTIDEPLWQQRANQFIGSIASGNLLGTMPTAQPGVVTMIVAGVTYRFQSLALDQAALGIMNSLLLLLTTYFLIQLWGKRWGLISGYFLALDPYFIAHSRLVHTDALMTSLALVAITAFLAGIKPIEKGLPSLKRYVIASGILTAAAILTKLFALLLIPMLVGIVIFTGMQYRQSFRSMLQLMSLWGLAMLVALYIIWPVLWIPKSPAYAYLYKWTTIHAEGLRADDVTSYWWFYLREVPFRLTIPTTLLLPLASLGVLIPKYRHLYPSQSRSALILLTCGIAYGIVMSFSTEKGDRYVLLTMLTLLLFSVGGLRLIVYWLKNAQGLQRFAPLPIAAILLFLAADDIRLHPYYLAHYNRLYPLEERHKVGLGEGLEMAANWIKTQQPDAKIATFAPRVINYFYPGSAESLDHINDYHPDYVVIYRGMFERATASNETKLVHEYLDSNRKPDHIVVINTLPYAWIYRHTQ